MSLLLLAIAMIVLIALRGRWTGTPGDHRDRPAPRPEEPTGTAPDVLPEPPAYVREKAPRSAGPCTPTSPASPASP